MHASAVAHKGKKAQMAFTTTLLRFLLHDVPGVEGLDGLNPNGNKLLPADLLVLVLIRQSNQHVDVIVVQAIGQRSKGVSEFLVGELA